MHTRRLSRIFRPDGRALIAAFDHGLIDGPIKGLEHPGETLAKIVAGGADAVLTSFGVASRYVEELASIGLILRLDGGGTKLGKMGPGAQFHTVEAALRLGADAVAVSAFPGAAHEEATLHTLATVIDEAHAWGMPVMAEMQPGGFDSGPDYCTAENVALSARVAAELGADWVKAPYAPDFGRVVDACYVPVVMLGGAKKNSERTMLENIKSAIAAGAAGVAIGRNIFQADDPRLMTAAVAAIVHHDASVDEAMSMLLGERA
jgi:DhnA family fructose-bisphosphate aldolase class Ia